VIGDIFTTSLLILAHALMLCYIVSVVVNIVLTILVPFKMKTLGFEIDNARYLLITGINWWIGCALWLAYKLGY